MSMLQYPERLYGRPQVQRVKYSEPGLMVFGLVIIVIVWGLMTQC